MNRDGFMVCNLSNDEPISALVLKGKLQEEIQ